MNYPTKLCLTSLPVGALDDIAQYTLSEDDPVNRWHQKLSPRHTGYASHFNAEFNAEAVSAHIDSFNNFIDSLKTTILTYIPPVIINLTTSHRIKVEVTDLLLTSPPFTPAFAREMKVNYCGDLHITIKVSDGPTSKTFLINAGEVPIMVGSKLCVLSGKSPKERIQLHEDERDVGGYFIMSGQEKVMRLHIDCLSNFPLAIVKYRSLSMHAEFAPAGIHYKGVREDGHVCCTTLQARKDSILVLRFVIDGRLIYVPVLLVLRALVSTTDKEIYNTICNICASNDSRENGYVALRVEAMLRDFHKYQTFSHELCKKFLGGRFRPILSLLYRYDLSDIDCCDLLFERYILINIPKEDTRAKFAMLCLMARKCLLLLGGFIKPDNMDMLSSQEALTPGAFFKAITAALFGRVTRLIELNAGARGAASSYQFSNAWIARNITASRIWRPITSALRSLAGTGTARTYLGHDYNAITGVSVLADRINYVRFLAHFRCINRGNVFSQHKITSIRKLYPESYGFQCAVHTPDGAPCGLLTHLCYKATVLSSTPSSEHLSNLFYLLTSFGISPCLTTESNLPIILNGTILGYMNSDTQILQLSSELRKAKVSGFIFSYTEIVCIERNNKDNLFPGIYLNTSMGRFSRPVHSLLSGTIEYITPLEQIFLQVAIYGDEVHRSGTTHQEVTPTSLLSILGLLVPFSDHNQSPRNMYECQMLKQTMAIPCRNLRYRYDAKTYLLTTPQKPLVRNAIIYDIGGFDTHPTGTNLVVAVCAYTSYDMEDAALINKASLERGLFHGTIYSVHDIDCCESGLSRLDRASADVFPYLLRSPDYAAILAEDAGETALDEDGLPPIGAYLANGSVFYQLYDPISQKYNMKRYFHEPGFVERVVILQRMSMNERYSVTNEAVVDTNSESEVVKLENKDTELSGSEDSRSGEGSEKESSDCTSQSETHKSVRISTQSNSHIRSSSIRTKRLDSAAISMFIQKVRIVIRHDRTPVIGDKVASRHGQKGIIGIRWRQTDMPFTATGIVPDLIINPHAFPSRMTVGMLIESLASKIGIHYADFIDSSPFQWSDERRAVDLFSEKLLKTRQFNRYGSEVMYSAMTGDPMPVDIFIGVVYYQRLRHMITDKYQVRAEGPLDKITKQPIKGRKRGGGLRFGEMERDALLAHGAMASLRGRLCTESDATEHVICAACGSLLGMQLGGNTCHECKATGQGQLIQIPMVLLVLANDLAAMGVRMRFSVSPMQILIS